MSSCIKHICLLLLAAFLWSCKKDIPPQRPATAGAISASRRLIICNEGNFGTGNATITFYDPVSGSVLHDAYSPANANQYIGDVLQSGVKFNEKYYWVVNNSSKVVVTDNNITRLASISSFISPRYIRFVSNNKAYVTNLQLNNNLPNYVQIFDASTNAISGSIRIDGWTEEMEQSYGKVYVCNQRKKYVYVIDAATDKLTDSIYVNATTACVVKDQNEKLWVSCNADATNNIPARLVKINPLTDSVETDISLQTTQNSVSRLSINGGGNTLYYLMGDLYKLPISSSAPQAAIVLQGTRAFYGLCIDPQDETIYVSDAIDYNQDGNILRYRADGAYLSTFKASVSPGYMWVDQ